MTVRLNMGGQIITRQRGGDKGTKGIRPMNKYIIFPVILDRSFDVLL
jgi:hypothetical protein